MRVRFAPSPTGALHIGGARAALYNHLAARGATRRGDPSTFVLRIEDTDRERSTEENVAQILDALQWLGLDWDEGPISQVSHEQRHREVVEDFLARGLAYRTTATGDDVKAWKEQHGQEKGYRGEDEGEGAVRLRVPEGETVVHDLIRGDTTFAHVHMDDPVIARADGSPLYNLAVAVDDIDLGITHVVRGEDHISNTPKQLLVYEALGVPAPIYAHLPLLHGPDGKKLSKRHGAASVQELRDAGYLPEAVINYLALLGWGDSDDQTILSRDELEERFDLARVTKHPARFDETKLKWLNGKYLREMSVDDLTARLEAHTGRTGLRGAVEISQEKIGTLDDFWPLAGFLFDGPKTDDAKAREQWLGEDGQRILGRVREVLAGLDPFDTETVEAALRELPQTLEAKPKAVFQAVRVALAGTTISPGLFESVALLGRDETLRRIDLASQGVPA
ncbi:MAG: glutamate--tRNA ligase [Solirubrobacteraceae bacterium]|nr:glutamate--tRNA ligase [Solirubrobacteraceae bacterium]